MTTHNDRIAVAGIDFSNASDQALVWGLRWLAEATDRQLHLFHVLDPRDVIDDEEQPALVTTERVIAMTPERLRDRAEALGVVAGIRVHHERLHVHARIGRAVDSLLQACVDYEADVLVVGTHGRSGLERALLGSVSEHLVRKARCPVVVARVRDYEGCEKTARPEPRRPEDEHAPRHTTPPHEPIVSTQSEGWRPSDTGPTGFRIV